MITDLIVLASGVFTVVFVLAWAVSPTLRGWIERPKHRFHDLSRGYDRSQRRELEDHQEQLP
jgi:hypothetical protein